MSIFYSILFIFINTSAWANSTCKQTFEPKKQMNSFNKTLEKAIVSNDIQKAMVAIQKGADINHQGDFGYTPLHIAALHDRVEIAQKLMDSKADKNILSDSGHTPLDIANIYEHVQTAKVLLHYKPTHQ